MRYFFSDCTLDTDRRELCREARLVPLEPQVFDLLEFLIRHRGRVIAKDEIVDAIWRGRAISDSTLSTRVNSARLAIGDSGSAQRLIRTLQRKGFRFVGEVREKGPTPANQQSDVPTAATDAPSIAVLPFDNLSRDPDQDYFADGMAEELITALTRCRWLAVIARNSTFTYRGKPVDVRQVGRELSVRYVFEGSIRRAGERLRFTGQLVDALNGVHLWAERFDGDVSDLFALQDRLTTRIVAAIEPRLQLAEIERQSRKPANDLNAYDLFLRALQHHHELTEGGTEAALDYLRNALDIDPAYAPAMALAAHCYAERSKQGWAKDTDGEAAEGLRLAKRAVELARDDSNVLWMAAWAYWILAQDTHHARDLVAQSIELNANSAAALALAGWIEVASGHSERAFTLLGKARQLNPRDPREWFVLTAMAAACLAAERFDEAASWAEQALARNPRFSATLRILAASLAMMRQTARAAETMKKLREIEPNLTLRSLRARMEYMDPGVWEAFSKALRIAGMPE